MSTIYRAYFTLCGKERFVDTTEGLAVLADGFWLNNVLLFTKGGDARYWIPPSALLYVKKLDGAG